MKLPGTLTRLLSFGMLIGMSLYSSANAEAPEKSPLEQVEAMVMLNENGIISISYIEPWFWEVGYYAMSLRLFLTESLKAANTECASLARKLTDNPEHRLGVHARRILDSQLRDGRIDDTRLISSLLKKYSRKNEIDIENASGKGQYTPLSGKVCSDFDADNPGYLQQMFPRPKDNPEAFYDPICEHIEKTATCLNELNVIDRLNRHRQGEDFTELRLSETFSLVSGSHSDDEV